LEFGVVFGEEGVVGVVGEFVSFELSWLVGDQGKEGREPGVRRYQGCSGYDGCGIVVIYSVVNCNTEGVRRDSVVLYLSIRL
jgi:hypothetical protein